MLDILIRPKKTIQINGGFLCLMFWEIFQSYSYNYQTFLTLKWPGPHLNSGTANFEPPVNSYGSECLSFSTSTVSQGLAVQSVNWLAFSLHQRLLSTALAADWSVWRWPLRTSPCSEDPLSHFCSPQISAGLQLCNLRLTAFPARGLVLTECLRSLLQDGLWCNWKQCTPHHQCR